MESSQSSRKSMMYYVRHAISNDFVRNFTKFLHIDTLGKNMYFNIFAPKDRKISHTIAGISAQFYVKNYSELIYLPEIITGIADERDVIKKVLDTMRPGDVVYDVGAFIGFHAVFFAKHASNNVSVVAFEPFLENYEHLNDNIVLNDLKNVTAVNIALGQQESKELMKTGDMKIQSPSDHSNTKMLKEITVMPGDLAIVKYHLPSPNVVKIDIEGYEYDALMGLKDALQKNSCRFVCCEVHPAFLPKGISPDDVVNLLKSFGFNDIERHDRKDGVFHVFCSKKQS